jgi:hypothetical protein
MPSRSLEAALSLATCCALATCVSGQPAGAVAEYPDVASYRAARERLVAQERARRRSAALVLSPEEETASRRLADLRKAEEDRVGEYFPPSHSYLLDRTKRTIEGSPLLEAMKRLPKGGILHLHGAAGGDFRWLVAHATYRPDCYEFLGDDASTVRGTLRFFPEPPGGDWRPVVALRNAAADPAAFDDGLYRSITLGEEDRDAAPRIGHGLALVRHPVLMEMVRQRGIAVEVCPISNQVLGYVPDLRAHPAVAYINAGIAVVLSPDDPGLTRHTLSYDFYEACLAWGLDLRDLKQLALDSLLHSAMAPQERARARASWERRWTGFVHWLNESR